jgi:hypothetical protein
LEGLWPRLPQASSLKEGQKIGRTMAAAPPNLFSERRTKNWKEFYGRGSSKPLL